MHRPILITLAALVIASGCKKDEGSPVDLGLRYFPTATGHWIEYQVDSLRTHNDSTRQWSYVIREVITEQFTDPEGRPAQRVIRYTRDTNNTWLPKDVWWQTRDNFRAERAEENMRRIKLSFPPKTTEYWNTNATNTADEFELTYDEVDDPWSANAMAFDSTVLVVGTYPTNPFFSKIYKERYAKNVGMVYREVDSSETQYSPNASYERYFVKYTITGYGN